MELSAVSGFLPAVQAVVGQFSGQMFGQSSLFGSAERAKEKGLTPKSSLMI